MDAAHIQTKLTEIADLARKSGEKVTGEVTQIKTEFGDFRDRANALILELSQKMDAGAMHRGRSSGGVSNFGALILKDAKLDALNTRNAWLNLPVHGRLPDLVKSVLGNFGSTGVSPAIEYPSTPDYLPGGPRGFAHRRLSILASLPSISVGGAAANFPKLVSNTENAGVQLHEGSLKNETVLDFANEILTSATIAHVVNASRQVISDSPLLAEFINQVMIFGVLKKLENLIVSGTGSSTDKITGLALQGTVYASGEPHVADKIGESIASLRSKGFVPDLCIVNAFDFYKVISARDANGRYISGGWSAASPQSLWGVNTVPTEALTSGTAIVLDTSQVTVLDREAANVQIGYVNDQFARNEVSILSEARAQLAVFDPRGVNVLQFTESDAAN